MIGSPIASPLESCTLLPVCTVRGPGHALYANPSFTLSIVNSILLVYVLLTVEPVDASLSALISAIARTLFATWGAADANRTPAGLWRWKHPVRRACSPLDMLEQALAAPRHTPVATLYL